MSGACEWIFLPEVSTCPSSMPFAAVGTSKSLSFASTVEEKNHNMFIKKIVGFCCGKLEKRLTTEIEAIYGNMYSVNHVR